MANNYPRMRRITQKGMIPTALKGRQLSRDILKNNNSETLTISLPAGLTVSVKSVIESSTNAGDRIGVLPYMIAFFETNLSTGNLIPAGGNITPSDYAMYGPYAMPLISSSGELNFGSNQNLIVMRASLRNTTGGAKTIKIVVGSRVMVTKGSAPKQE